MENYNETKNIEKEEETKPFDVKNLLSESFADYSDIIERVAWKQKGRDWYGDDLQTNFSSYIDNSFDRYKEYFEKGEVGEILVDVGGGSYFSERIARKLGVDVYISVNKYLHEESLPLDPRVNLADSEKMGGLQVAYIKDDMLDFLARLKANSVSIMINGIDGAIINDQDYLEALVREIFRVVKPEGLIFGNNSSALNSIYMILDAPKYNSGIADEELKKAIRDKLEKVYGGYGFFVFKKKL